MNENQARNIAERYCSGAEHCCSEVRAMLERHGAEKDVTESVIRSLLKERYIDESRYARALVHDKVRFARWGRQKIAQALWQKRIPDEISQEALQGIDMDEYMTALKDTVKSKYRVTKGTTEYERKIKTMKSVCSRGYEPNLVRSVLDMREDCNI